MKKIIIFGSGYHSKVVLDEILNLKKFKIIGFIDEFLPIKTVINRDYNLVNLGKIKNLKSIVDSNTVGVIGIGANYVREKIVKQVNKIIKNFVWEKIVSSKAKVSKNVEIGEGSVIIQGSVINTGTKIEKHCIINTGSLIDHDNIFLNYSACGPGAILGGCVSVGKLSYIGIGTTIKHGIKIGEHTIIGGHSFVNKNCEKKSLYFGIPAKKIRVRNKNDKYL